jgi:formylglycine-generating enzyme required for sulfatase activity
MGVVYLAHDALLDRHVAVKFITALDDAAVARFLVEARAAARVQHPNVATLYRVGQLDERPYLIYELVRGTPLDQLARPLDSAEVLPLAIDLARGLAASHRRGVLHRDIKPGNAIRTEAGEVKLLDFGVAKLTGAPDEELDPEAVAARLSEEDEQALREMTQGQLLGTPYFMSPEAWRGRATERSDLFSLGLVLYELLAGKGPFRDVPLADLPRAVLDRDARPLRAVAPAVPEGLAAVVDRMLRRDPDERFASADDLLVQLEALRPARAGAVPEGNPYRGLRPFEPEHRAVFFGRQRAIAQAIERLRVEPFLLVTGDSGVGKSSICAAGLLPMVSEGALEDGRTWQVARFIPGRAPLVACAAALAPVLGVDARELERGMTDDPSSLGRLARRRLREHEALLVYVDQLEELVTLAPPAEAARAGEAIGALALGLPGVRLLATARSDFLSRLEALPGLRDRVSRALLLLAPLGRDEVREAVVGPAAVKQTRFESEALVDALVDSTVAAQGAMPLLQFALAELWERRDATAGVIPQAALDALGGVSGALSRHADGLVNALLPGERLAARKVLLRLVTVEHTRARRLEEELLGLSPHARGALDALTRGRLAVASERAEGTTYEIAHEALLEGWQTLASWLAEEAETRAVVHRIETAAAEWRRHGRRRELLWTPRQLAEAAVAIDALTTREQEFLEVSRRAATRARWLRRAAVVVVLLAAIGIWVGARIKAGIDRDRQIEAELGRADQLLATARDLDGELVAARAAALAIFDAGRADDGEAAWDGVVALRGRALAAFRDAGEPVERALLLDASRHDVRRRLGELLLERARVAEREGQLTERDEAVQRMLLYDDGDRLRRAWQAPGTLTITSDPPGAQVRLARYRRDGDRLVLDDAIELGVTPLAGVEIAPGSLRLELAAPDRPPVVYPLVVGRGEEAALEVPIPVRIPDGFVYVPPGDGPFGSGDAEEVRGFFFSIPVHPVRTEGYLIAKHETTFADWLAFLEELPDAERDLRTPRVGGLGVKAQDLALTRLAPGRWRLAFKPGSVLLEAETGQPVRYPERTLAAAQRWERWPVVGISYQDVTAYTSWLDRSGRLPGARPCTEPEWERAARGADDRVYPHGYALAPTDANFDETYGKVPASFGLDEVGSHPASRSPFGVDDLSGNVWEWVSSHLTDNHAAARGGSFAYASPTARIPNREKPEPTYRDVALGVRICASLSSEMKGIE